MFVRIRYSKGGDADDVTTTLVVDRRASVQSVLDSAYNKLRNLCNLAEPKAEFCLFTDDGHHHELGDMSAIIAETTYVTQCHGANTIPNLLFLHASMASREAGKKNTLSLSLPVFLNNLASGTASITESFSNSMKRPPRSRASTLNSPISPLTMANLGSSRGPHSPSSASSKHSVYTPLMVEIPDAGDFDIDVMSSVSSISTRSAQVVSSNSSLSGTRDAAGSRSTEPAISTSVQLEPASRRDSDQAPTSPLRTVGLRRDFNRSASTIVIAKIHVSEDCITHVQCVPGMTIAHLLEKAVTKLHRMSGIPLAKDGAELQTGDGSSLPPPPTLLEDVLYYQFCKSSNTEPVFRLVLTGHRSGANSRKSSDASERKKAGTDAGASSAFGSSSNDDDDSIFSLIEAYRTDSGPTSIPLQPVSRAVSVRSTNTVSGRPSQHDSSSLNTALPTITSRFVRLELPKGVNSNVAVAQDTTVDELLEKGVQKIARVLGVQIDHSELTLHLAGLSQMGGENDLTPSTFPEGPALPVDALVVELDALRSAPANCVVTFRVRSTSPLLERIPEVTANSEVPSFFTIRRTSYDTLTRLNADEPQLRSVSVRVLLPKGVITNVRITAASNAQFLLQRGIEKLRSLLGEQAVTTGYQVFIERPGAVDPTPLPSDYALGKIPEIDAVVRGNQGDVGDSVSFVIRAKPSAQASATSPGDEQGWAGSGATLSSSQAAASATSAASSTPQPSTTSPSVPAIREDRRASITQLLAKRTRLITVEDVYRDMLMFDGPATERRSSFIPPSQLGPRTSTPSAASGFGSSPTLLLPPSGPGTASAGPSPSATIERGMSLAASTSFTGNALAGSAPGSANSRLKRLRPASLSFTEFIGPLHLKVSLVFSKDVQADAAFMGEDTITTVKAALWEQVVAKLCACDTPDTYALYYRHPKTHVLVHLADERQTLRQMALVREWQCDTIVLRALKQGSAGVTSPSAGQGQPSSSTNNNMINVLLGAQPSQMDAARGSELALLRKRLKNLRHHTTRGLTPDAVDVDAGDHPSPYLRSKMAGTKSKIALRLHFPHWSVVRTLSCGIHERVLDVTARIVEKYSLQPSNTSDQFHDELMLHLAGNAPPEPAQVYARQLVLQLVGRPEYLSPAHRLIDHRSIRYLVSRGEQINLMIANAQRGAMHEVDWTFPTLLRDAAPEVDDATVAKEVAADEYLVEEGRHAPGTHAELTLRGRDRTAIKMMSLWDLSMNLRVEIIGADGLGSLTGPQALSSFASLYVEASIAFGGRNLCASVRTHLLQPIVDPRWHNFIIFDIPIYNLPRNARLCVTVYGMTPVASARGKRAEVEKPTTVPLGSVCILVIDDGGYLRQGTHTVRLWEGQAAPLIGPVTAPQRGSGPSVTVRFEEYTHPVVFPDVVEAPIDDLNFNEMVAQGKEEVGDDMKDLEEVIKWDALVPLEDPIKRLLWSNRLYLASIPESLPKVLLAANWDQLEDVLEVRRLLKLWKPISTETALLLLDAYFADDDVRAYAVNTLEALSDEALGDYLMQLVQALSFEHRVDSALARFLLKRALMSSRIGHFFFWALKAEMTKPTMFPLFCILLEGYLRGCPAPDITDLLNQKRLVDQLAEAAMAVKSTRVADRRETLVSMVQNVSVARGQRVPLNPDLHVSEIRTEKCKFMDSKKLPLWIVFRCTPPPDQRPMDLLTVSVGNTIKSTAGPPSPLPSSGPPSATSFEFGPRSVFSPASAGSSTLLPSPISAGAEPAASLGSTLAVAAGGSATTLATSSETLTPSTATNGGSGGPGSGFTIPAQIPRTPSDLLVIFKTGDDLRQDALTLQMLRIMDRLWRKESLDLRMTLYGCMSTGREQGFIEVVTQSATVSSIQLAYGGSTAAFKEEPLERWIRQNNPDEAEYDRAVTNFTLSCAGYCVATFCLGIGDRHNDNIMCHERGRLFHIDFGHFLGNMKRKFGIKRERAPFVLTPDFVHVISKKNPANFEFFVATAVRAYLVLRRNANIFMNLFLLMLSTGIPELQTVDDLSYLRDAFCLGMSEAEAAEEFQGLIYESIRLGWSTQLNWWVHNLAHGIGK
ncbi:Phosphatidylinositol 4,5-bisphosphate 3-kinase catalytic subunit alpha isoform [Blastocladiella emersonii ATCC 22665]|nr:Phosphatidylinositol 4,5-bisphosphate 3-kinase catalytic subunit alpha isoform [Blastocladiella emersonii ATCC 22665]